MNGETHEITELLRAHRAGDAAALSRLVDLIYPELRRIARMKLARAPGQRVLDTSGLVHEAYLKLAEGSRSTWNDRRHFFAVASRAMRQILVDAARQRRTAKRGGGRRVETLDDNAGAASTRFEDLLALDEALERLTEVDPRLTRIVECRYFAGFTGPETAEALGISESTVQREWKLARRWLRAELSP